MKFSKQNITDIPFVESHGVSQTKQVLLDVAATESKNWENVTKGILPSGQMYDWHVHEGIDELFIVTKGNGKFYCEDEATDYKVNDIIMVRAGMKHKIENTGKETTEGFFIRVKV